MADTVPVLAVAAPTVPPEPPSGRRMGALALLDQAFVSGASFLTAVLVGRFAGEEQLGLYSLGFTCLVIIVCLQDALLATPYTVIVHRHGPRERALLAGHVFLHHLLLGGLALIALGGMALALWLTDAWWVEGGDPHPLAGLATVLAVVAGVAPGVLLRELRRRVAFAHLDFLTGVILDAVVTVAQLSTLLLLGLSGMLGAVSAHLAVGLVGLIAGAISWWGARRLLDIRTEGSLREFTRSWSFGRWVVAGQMVGVVHGFLLYWLLGLLLGSGGTGTFAACMTVVTLANPLLLGLSNLLGPSLAHASAEGQAAVRQQVGWASLLLASVVGVFAIVVFFIGDPLLGFLYGANFTGHGTTLDLLALGTLAMSFSVASDHGLRAVGRPETSFHCGLTGLLVTLVASLALIGPFGLPGGAAGYLLGNATASALRGFAFLAITATPKEAV